jgi:hypothetical protein
MDRLKMRMAMMKDLGDSARQHRLAKQKQKYAGVSPEMAADLAKQDEVVDAAALPGADVSDLPTDKWNAENKAAIEAAADPLEDEEMQKWMAKQRG